MGILDGMRVKALMWSVLCQQRLAGQYRAEDVHGLVLGDSMELAYQMLTSTGGAKHDYFMLDGSYDHFYFFTNNHQGEVILALLCDPLKTAELNRILSQGLVAGNPGRATEQDAAEPDGTPVLFGYSCDLPRITRFNTSLDLMGRPGTLICFDFQADVLRRYCGSWVRLQTIDFTKAAFWLRSLATTQYGNRAAASPETAHPRRQRRLIFLPVCPVRSNLHTGYMAL